MKLIVAGSRGFKNQDLIWERLSTLTKDHIDLTIISGTAQGADRIGELWAIRHNVPLIRMPAHWNLHGRRAGYIRNEEMAKIATHCLCFWDLKSPGTKHMIDIARRYGLPTQIIDTLGFTRFA